MVFLCSVERLDHGILQVARDVSGVSLTQSENGLDHTQLSCGGIKTGNSQPVVNNHSCADDGGTSVDGASDEWNLEKRGQLILVLDRGLWVDDSSLVGECHVRSDQDVVGNGLTENLDAENIGDDFLGFALNIWVDKCDMVVTDDYVSECR